MLQRLFSQKQWELVLDLLLVCFHFKKESTDLIYWYTYNFFLNSLR